MMVVEKVKTRIRGPVFLFGILVLIGASCFFFLTRSWHDLSLTLKPNNIISSSTWSSTKFQGDHTIQIEAPLGELPTTPDASIVNIAYGPIMAATHKTSNIFKNVQKPCTDCYLTAMRAVLLSSNGTELFTNSNNIWLHHIIFFNRGQKDTVCPEMAGERFFGGGNERDTWRWNSHGAWGYEVQPGDRDQWDIAIEVMNDNQEDIEVYIDVRFEVIERNGAVRYRSVTPVWLDMTGCGNAELEAKSLNESFSYQSPIWRSTVEGIMVVARGHMHDGGLRMRAFKNGEVFCISEQLYNNQDATQHIVGGGVCKYTSLLQKGDLLLADAAYNPRIHRLVMHDGEVDAVMGAMGVFVGKP